MKIISEFKSYNVFKLVLFYVIEFNIWLKCASTQYTKYTHYTSFANERYFIHNGVSFLHYFQHYCGRKNDELSHRNTHSVIRLFTKSNLHTFVSFVCSPTIVCCRIIIFYQVFKPFYFYFFTLSNSIWLNCRRHLSTVFGWLNNYFIFHTCVFNDCAQATYFNVIMDVFLDKHRNRIIKHGKYIFWAEKLYFKAGNTLFYSYFIGTMSSIRGQHFYQQQHQFK